MREHGAVFLGKTTMPEYGWKATSDSPLTGLTRNPWDTRMTTGGSSSGAVASAVLGMGALQLGTDGGGSIRIPAAFTGCFGIKPTRARVPIYPAAPLGTIAHHGPLTRTVTDAAIVMSVISQPDARDVYAWLSPPTYYTNSLDDGVRGLRIAYSPRLGYAPRVDPEIEAAVAKAARTFESLGAKVEQADPDLGGDPIDGLEHHLVVEHGAGPAGVRRPRRRNSPIPGLLAGAAQGAGTLATDYMRAQLKRAELHNVFVRFHADLRSAADALAAAAGLRGRASGAAVGRMGHGVVRLGALQLPVQPHPAAGRLRAVRVHQPGPAHRLADRRTDRRRRPRAAAPAAPSRRPRRSPCWTHRANAEGTSLRHTCLILARNHSNCECV